MMTRYSSRPKQVYSFFLKFNKLYSSVKSEKIAPMEQKWRFF